jgi:hypothetical protein
MAMNRSGRFLQMRKDQKETREVNRLVKVKERARREARMLEKLRSGSLPYTPAVMSWMSRKLDKRSSSITPEDVQRLLSPQ